MADTPYLGEIMWISWSFAPDGWAFCNGQLLPINQNQALFSLLGTRYGGDGQTTFALPDLRGRSPIDATSSNGARPVGTSGGTEAHTLTVAELPAHLHGLPVSGRRGSTDTPSGGVYAAGERIYTAAGEASAALHGSSLTSTGGSQAHYNRQPYLALNAVIALQGVFPSPS